MVGMIHAVLLDAVDIGVDVSAAAVGGRGGGRQVLFRDAGKGLLSVEELLETGLLEEVRERA